MPVPWIFRVFESPPKNAVSGRGPMVHTTAYEAQDDGFFLELLGWQCYNHYIHILSINDKYMYTNLCKHFDDVYAYLNVYIYTDIIIDTECNLQGVPIGFNSRCPFWYTSHFINLHWDFSHHSMVGLSTLQRFQQGGEVSDVTLLCLVVRLGQPRTQGRRRRPEVFLGWMIRVEPLGAWLSSLGSSSLQKELLLYRVLQQNWHFPAFGVWSFPKWSSRCSIVKDSSEGCGITRHNL